MAIRIGGDVIDSRRLRQRVSILKHAVDVQRQRLGRHAAAGVIESPPGGDATRKIREAHALVGGAILM
jgi:hypothetical protein